MKLGRTESTTTKQAQAFSSLWCAYRDHRPMTSNTFRLVVTSIQEPGSE